MMHHVSHRVALILRVLALTCTFVGTCVTVTASGNDGLRIFTEQRPLVYEDAWDLWPYAFLNENGDAVGYNIDLLKLIFKELNIPYIIRLKPTKEALADLKTGSADLMLGMDASFHNDYALYGKSVIQIFTHSILHRKDEPVLINTINDLAHNKVIVHEGSFSHHLMKVRGWAPNAVPYDDMREAVRVVHNTSGNQIVWNTLSLQWLVRTLQFDDLELTSVDVPHGEYKFMSNNSELLYRMDSVYTSLNASGQLQAIQNKWFYPERKDSGIPSWIWWAIAGLLLLTFFLMTYYAFYRRYEMKMTKNIRRVNDRLSLILKTSNVHIWLYMTESRTITKFDDNGYVEVEGISMTTFFATVVPEDIRRIVDALELITRQKTDKLTIEARRQEGNEGLMRNFTIDLSVLRRNKSGQPTHIIGTTSDVTEEKLRRLQVKDTMLRYHSIFDSVMVDTLSYDAGGYVIDMNEKASHMFLGGKEGAIQRKVNLKDVMGDSSLVLEELDPVYMTCLYEAGSQQGIFNEDLNSKRLYYEIQLVPVRDENNRLQEVYATGRDVTEVVDSFNQQKENVLQMQRVNDALNDYIRNIDFVMQNGGVRMVNYSPETHTLIIYSEIAHVQYQLTQTRCLSLVAENSRKAAQRVINMMDNRVTTPVESTIRTVIRLKNGKSLCLFLSFVPNIDSEGVAVEYFGMCRDISDLKATEEELAQEAAKAQEVETVKNAFLRNMSYEIRIPLNSVVGFAELFEEEHTSEDEEFFIAEIRDNSEHLLALINDILFLSRLDAQMIESKKKSIDFAAIFESRCKTAWSDYQRLEVNYSTDNPYEHLVVDIDEQNLGIVINQLVASAARFTKEGQVRTRYDYTGEDLVFVVQATDGGILEEVQAHIFDRFVVMHEQGTGLEMSICYELVRLMGGKIHFRSNASLGTIIWVSVPCKCSELVRK